MPSVLAPFCVNVRLSVLPARRSEFLEVIRSDQRQTLKEEEGSLQFLVMEDVNDSNTFYFHEEYVDEAAFKAHCSAPHFQPWQDFTATSPSPFRNPIEVNTFIARGERTFVTKIERSAVTADFNEMEKYCVWVNLFPREEIEIKTAFNDCIARNKLGTDTMEPLARQYTWGEVSTTFPRKFAFFEVYDGKGGFDAHTGATHFAEWEEFASQSPSPFASDPEVFFARVI